MKSVAAVVCLYATVVLSSDTPTGTAVTAAPGDVALLPCYTSGIVSQSLTTWAKDGREVARGGGGGGVPAGQRLSVLANGTLNIPVVTVGDGGVYRCNTTLGNITFTAEVELRVADGPDNVSVSISPAMVLSNHRLATYQGSSVLLNCSGWSFPSAVLTWSFKGASSSNDSLESGSGPLLFFRINEIQPEAQGVYTCTARNTLSGRTASNSTELLVYYVPDRHPECSWAPAQDPIHFRFICSWFGAYPTPTLVWGEDRGPGGEGPVFGSEVTDSLSVVMNRSLLYSEQTLKCTAQHLAVVPGKETSCSFTLRSPYPKGDPFATALETTNVTLTCNEEASVPPANTTWRRGLQQEEIIPGSKYVLSVEGPALRLTILNVTKDDEGIYFCRSENPLAVMELEVCLTVKSSSVYTGAVIGVFIAVLIVGSSIIVAKTIYSSRHYICLDGGFGQTDDHGDVLSLVESDDEQILHEAVPRLPPLTRDTSTTLVEIHRISSDTEDAEITDTNKQQLDDTLQTEEPPNLLMF